MKLIWPKKKKKEKRKHILVYDNLVKKNLSYILEHTQNKITNLEFWSKHWSRSSRTALSCFPGEPILSASAWTLVDWENCEESWFFSRSCSIESKLNTFKKHLQNNYTHLYIVEIDMLFYTYIQDDIKINR